MHSLALVLATLAVSVQPAASGRAGQGFWGSSRAEVVARSRAVAPLLADEAGLTTEFRRWAEHFQRPDGNYKQWKRGLQRIVQANSQNLTWWAAPNRYTDLSWEEFQAQVLGSARQAPAVRLRAAAAAAGGGGRRRLQTAAAAASAPNAKDWAQLGGVTSIKNQGSCGGCWAYAAAAGVESKVLIKTGRSLDLSEGQLLDCVTSATNPGYWSHGCNGGWPSNGLDYAARYSVALGAVYPSATGACQQALLAQVAADQKVQTQPAGYKELPEGSAGALLEAVSRGPVVNVFSTDENFAHYAGGIFSSSACSCTSVNHAMLIVGYDKTAGIGGPGSYWKIKNSWDTWWGESGYARVAMEGDGTGTCAMYLYNWEVTDPSGATDSASTNVLPSPSPSPARKRCRNKKRCKCYPWRCIKP